MKTATVRDLRNQFARISSWIEEGECVEITKGGRPFARLTPTPAPRKAKVERPDFMARMKKYMPEPLPPGSSESVMDYDRGER